MPLDIITCDAAAPKAAGIMYKTPDSQVLYMFRGPDKETGNVWAFPAGHIEDGETPEQAAYREFFEETGLDLGNTPLIRIGHTKSGFVLFVAHGPKFDPRLNDEHTGIMWAKLGYPPEPQHPGIEEAFEHHAMDTARQKDFNGWVEIKRNPLSKVGVFPYKGRQIDDACDPDETYMVYRPQEELSSENTLESFKLIPWIDEHVMLGPKESGLMAAEAKGIEGVIGEDVFFEGGTLYGNLKIFSDNMDGLIGAGKRELSAGYRCRYEKSSGVFEGQSYDYVQRDIRGNHLALVNQGRMGPDVAVLDHLMQFTFDARDTMPEADMKKEMDELKKTVADCMKSMDDRLGAMDKRVTDAMEEEDPAIAADKKAKDEKEEEEKKAEDKKALDAAIKGAMDAALQPIVAQLTALASAKTAMDESTGKASLLQKLSQFGVALDGADALPLADLQSKAAEKLGLTCEKGQERAALDGYFTNRTPVIDEVGYALDTAAQGSGKAVDDFFKAA